MQNRFLPLVVLLAFAFSAAVAQQPAKTPANEATAKHMVELERKWAESACAANGVVQDLLAEDFKATSTDGRRVTKADELRDEKGPHTARNCQLDEAEVHFFSDSVAVIYGAERRVMKNKAGVDATRCQVWTDTWLKRNGRWQVVAAQDTVVDCK